MGALIPLIPLTAIPNCGGRRVFKNDLDLAVFRIGNAVYAIQEFLPAPGRILEQRHSAGKNGGLPRARSTFQSRL